MKTLEATSWQRNGSTLLFGLEQIQELLKKKSMVSLQEFLTWGGDIPDDPPIPEDSRTILVCGLETVMETLSPDEAQNFLRKKVRPVIQNVQNIWTDTGIVFCFPQGGQSFRETHSSREEVLFLRSDNQEIHVSEGLWDGTADQNMQRIEAPFITEKQMLPVGYYVRRIS